jgi:hypothetical protein
MARRAGHFKPVRRWLAYRPGGGGASPCGSPRWHLGDEAACIEERSEFKAARPFVTVVEAYVPGLPQGGAPQPPVVTMAPSALPAFRSQHDSYVQPQERLTLPRKVATPATLLTSVPTPDDSPT